MSTSIHLAGASGPILVAQDLEDVAARIDQAKRLARFTRQTRDGSEGAVVLVNADHVVSVEAVEVGR